MTLVIHPGPLGDVLLAVPALRALRAAPSPGPLVIAAQPRLGALLAALGVVDGHRAFDALGLEPLFVDDGAPAPVPAVRAASRVVCWFGARDPVFVRRLREAAPGAVVASPTGDGTRPVWQHLLETVGAPPGPWRDPLPPSAALAASGRAALAAAGWDGTRPLVLVHAGSGSAGKRWPVDGFARALAGAAAGRRLAVVLVQGPADAEAVSALAARLPAAGVLADAPLGEVAGAAGHADAWLGNDSGASHLAAVAGAPALVLFQEAHLAWRPWPAAAHALAVDTSRVTPGDVERVVARLRGVLEAAA